MNIAEIFYSIQGEGKHLGVPSVFVRTSGCNLRCTWCDTPYASWNPVQREMSIREVVTGVAAYPSRHVVITGGEPMLQKDLPELVESLTAMGRFITLETAGTLWQDLPLGLASVSPKLANSTPRSRDGGRFATAHERGRLVPEVLRRFVRGGRIADVQWKFVVSDPTDLEEIQQILEIIGGIAPEDVIVMPEGITTTELAQRSGWIAEACKRRGWRISPRLHVWLYGNTPGT